ncbi:MAG: hypothetical protein V3R49_01890 [Gammaproteobacteria bacterium]
MGVPTEEELQIALKEAAQMREKSEDPNHIAKALLNHNYRIKQLEKVMHAAELFIRSGEGGHEHAELVRAIKTAKSASTNTVNQEKLDYGP